MIRIENHLDVHIKTSHCIIVSNAALISWPVTLRLGASAISLIQEVRIFTFSSERTSGVNKPIIILIIMVMETQFPCMINAALWRKCRSLTHTQSAEPSASGNGDENTRKQGISAFFPPKLVPTLRQPPPPAWISMRGDRGASRGGRPSAVTLLLSQSLLKQAKFITKLSEAGFLQYSRGLGHSCFRIKLQ